MLHFEIAGTTHVGRQRPNNEDRVVIDPSCGLVVVADGMSGEHAGEVAAETSCRSIADVVRRAGLDEPVLADALGAAAARVAELGSGTTVAAVRIVPGEALAEIAHVGDVRVYVVRKGAAAVPSASPRYCPPVLAPSGAVMVCATRDHSSVCELVERGHLERDAAAKHPLRSRISRALGHADARPDLHLLPLLANDRIVVCTDGLWSLVADAEIARIVETGDRPEATCKALVDAALAAGGTDNIGVAVVHWHVLARRPTASTPPTNMPDGSPTASLAAPALPLPRALSGCRDITAAARAGELDPVIGREREVVELARALVQRRKPNALLLGEPGVGKTSIVEALAQRAVAADAGEGIARLRIAELSLTELIAGTKFRGELEQRIGEILIAAEQDPDLVLFIDELHAVAPGAADSPGATLASALKPALSRGRIRIIGATTNAEFERHLARDEAFTRRFELIQITEPSPDQTKQMLHGLRSRLEAHYRTKVDDTAIDAAVEFSIRYMPDRRFPDKAVDLIDRACARKMLETLSRRGSSGAPVRRADVAATVAERCRLPVALVERDAQQVLASVDGELARRIKGQDAALAQIAGTLRRAHSALRDPQRPIASLLLAGPTGVGKTATARAIAESMFGRDALVRIDMSELSERNAIARLLGAPPGYAGHGDEGQLTGAVRRRPACVVLFDELEKAHPDVLLLLLQLLGDGQLTDARGRAASFRETIVVMTTNLPLAEPRQRGFLPTRDRPTTESDAANREALAARLAPELVGRIDAVVAFRALEAADHAAIVDTVVARLEHRLRTQGVTPPDGAASRQRVLSKLDALGFGVRQVERIAEQVVADALDLLAAPTPGDDLASSIRTRALAAMLVVAGTGTERLVETLRCHHTASDLRSIEHTAAGVLALYDDVESAIECAADLGAELRRLVHFGRMRQKLAISLELPAGVFVTGAARDRLADPKALKTAGRYRLDGLGEVELWTHET